MIRRAVVVLILLLGATPVWAQVHIQLVGGATSAADRKPFVGGAFGGRLSFLEIDVEAGRMLDIVPEGIISRLNELQIERDLPVQAIAEVPVSYAFVSLRVISPSGPIRPFLAGGAGLARVEPRLNVVIADISLGDVFGLTSVERTDSMAVGAAGVRIDLGSKAHFDLGYRYVRIYADFLPDSPDSDFLAIKIAVHSVYGALGLRF